MARRCSNDSIDVSGFATCSRPRSRRGIAMMLVLVALLVTTILVGAALTSRNDAPAIGANAASAAEATWSAESAANFAVGAIAQASDLTTLLGGDDTLSSSLSINGATVDVKVTNLEGNAPADTDRELIVRATAKSDGVDKIVEKHMTRLPGGEAPDAADPYLKEFAVFTTGQCTIQDTTKIGVWDLSPEASSSLGMAKIGAGFTNAGDMSIDPTADLSRAGLYCDTDASIALETYLASAGALASWKIPLDVPTLPDALPLAFSLLPSKGTDVSPTAGSTLTVAAPGQYNGLQAQNGATVILDNAVSPNFQFQDVTIDSGGTLEIRGTVSVYVAHSFTVDTGYIVLADSSSSVTFYVACDLRIDQLSKVGIDPADVSTAAGVVTTYVSPARCRLIALSTAYGGSASPQWDLDHTSAIIGLLHNPLGLVRIHHDVSLFGHAVAQAFRMESGCSVLYCPTLDSHIGYTTSDACPFYDANADPVADLVAILDDVAATTTNANGFINKFMAEYDAAKSDGTLTSIDLIGGTKTITTTLNIGGDALY